MANSGTFSADGYAYPDAKGYHSTGALNTLYLSGTWGSGTVTVEASPDDGTTWVAVPDLSFTANSVKNLVFRFTKIRLKLNGATNPTLAWALL